MAAAQDKSCEDSRQPAQTLQRGLDMLEQLETGPLSLAEMSSRMELSRSTAYRLAKALLDRGYLDQVSHGRYGLGPRMRVAASRDHQPIGSERLI